MRITVAQLNEYIDLYKQEYGIELDRMHALSQLQKLITLVLYMALPEKTAQMLAEKMTEE